MALAEAKALKETSIPTKWTTPKECRHLAPRLASGIPTGHTTKLRRCVGNRYSQILLESYSLPMNPRSYADGDVDAPRLLVRLLRLSLSQYMP